MKAAARSMSDTATKAMRAVKSERRLNAAQNAGTASANVTAPALTQLRSENNGNPQMV